MDYRPYTAIVFLHLPLGVYSFLFVLFVLCFSLPYVLSFVVFFFILLVVDCSRTLVVVVAVDGLWLFIFLVVLLLLFRWVIFFEVSGRFCWSLEWLFPILMLLNDCIISRYWVEWFLLFFVWSATGKNDILREIIHTDWWFIWPTRITDPYRSYRIPIRMFFYFIFNYFFIVMFGKIYLSYY